MCMCVYYVYVHILCMYVYVFSLFTDFIGSLKTFPQSGWWNNLGEIPLCQVNRASEISGFCYFLISLCLLGRSPRPAIGGRCLGFCMSFYYDISPPSSACWWACLSCCLWPLISVFLLPSCCSNTRTHIRRELCFPMRFTPASAKEVRWSFTDQTMSPSLERREWLGFKNRSASYLPLLLVSDLVHINCVFHVTRPYLHKDRNSENFHDPVHP